jgi:hypothetical protein
MVFLLDTIFRILKICATVLILLTPVIIAKPSISEKLIKQKINQIELI